MPAGRPSKYPKGEEPCSDLLTIEEACALTKPIVYALCDMSGVPFYVGRTRRPRARFRAHARGATDNNLLREQVAKLGSDIRVAVLQFDPKDIQAAERAEIAKRSDLVNLVGGHHWAWSKHATAPWSAGNKALCPSEYAANRMRPHVAKQYRKRVAELSQRDRSRYEIDLMVSLPEAHAKPLTAWARAVAPKLLAAAEVD